MLAGVANCLSFDRVIDGRRNVIRQRADQGMGQKARAAMELAPRQSFLGRRTCDLLPVYPYRKGSI
jgi:hypothetical protein